MAEDNTQEAQETDGPKKASDQIVLQWQSIIATQMHFNDMILRTRAIGSSMVLAVYGYAFLTLVQQPAPYLSIFCLSIHVSFLLSVLHC
ncbi:MAG: hypothetical protein HN658_07605 [Rhodospirillales bacterium]|nr:hypothetical protein [Rhodospirillales bacterium]MBT4006039.1 hypothetical protein [Rhodospirillales bacterium]MBT5076589.1 hypothetical protein [Rhodospirillales bacterium]MBT5112782.1 hypothetical protein [Rhodospirillales bacterium]MBT5673552.1 hypothetical protein [Rhodospirillales bacterium]